ncbi:aminotransferase class I/II-fold pyridoxal phosphate-dependent enzyme [Zeaxanthinibacter enoshimensis]|uniref:aminotransferase class I/II-fold pyridoxal phosphate-dependent enzyme n=1 Tax=Zeaxanthinibacter enoshimensis TaxID=392009 RepID=UPI0035613764
MKFHVDHIDGRLAYIKQRPYLYFGGTSYLGIPYLKEFKEILKDKLDYYGTSYGSSRLSNFRLGIYEEAEAYFSRWSGSESCLTVSSGYLAGQMLSTSLQEEGHPLYYAPQAHTAMYRAQAKPYASWKQLQEELQDYLSRKQAKPPVLFMDSIDHSGAGYPDFPNLGNLPLDKIILVMDDSHGIGMIGEGGVGIYSTAASLNPLELISCASLNKAMGIPGGIILGNRARTEKLRNSPFFSGASPIPPAYLAAYLAAPSLYQQQYLKLQEQISYFESLLPPGHPFSRIAGHPVYTFKAGALAEHLFQAGILTTYFPYSGQNGRLVLNANHTKKDIDILSDALQNQ